MDEVERLAGVGREPVANVRVVQRDVGEVGLEDGVSERDRRALRLAGKEVLRRGVGVRLGDDRIVLVQRLRDLECLTYPIDSC